MKMNRKVVAVLALVALVVGVGIAYAQVTSLSTDIFGRFRGNGPAPTASTCGTAPVVAGTDTAGTVTIGTGTPSACTLTFARTWTNIPACYFNDNTTANKTNGTGTGYLVATSATAVTVTFTGATVNGDVISYMCVGF